MPVLSGKYLSLHMLVLRGSPSLSPPNWGAAGGQRRCPVVQTMRGLSTCCAFPWLARRLQLAPQY